LIEAVAITGATRNASDEEKRYAELFSHPR
jgi:hypothetical protein